MKRFDIETCCGGPAYLVGNLDGKYVKYEEVEALQAQRDQLLAALEKLACMRLNMIADGVVDRAIAAARGDK